MDNTKLEFREITCKDYPELVQFLTQFYQNQETGSFWRERIQAWWDLNPACKETVIKGFLLKDQDKIVGFMGNAPQLFKLKDRNIVVNSLTTGRVLPEYRTSSMKFFREFVKISKETLLFDTSPTPSVVKIISYLKFSQITPPKGFKVFVYPNFRAVLKRGGILGRMVYLLLWPFIKSWDCLTIGRFSGGAYAVKKVDTLNDSFDQLWHETKDLFEATNVRSKEVLQWRCFSVPDLTKTILGCYEDQRLLGYIIGQETKVGMFKVLLCYDFWGYFSDSDMVSSLVKSFIEYGKQSHYDFIAIPGYNDAILGEVKKLLLFQHRAKNYYVKDALNQLQTLKPYYVIAQGDIGLF